MMYSQNLIFIIFTERICSPVHYILMKWHNINLHLSAAHVSQAPFILYRSFCAGTKPYWIGLLFTHENGDSGAISVTERSSATRTGSLKWGVTYRIDVYTKYREVLMSAQQSIRCNVKIAWKTCPALRCINIAPAIKSVSITKWTIGVISLKNWTAISHC